MYKYGEIVTIMNDPGDERFKRFEEVVIVKYIRATNVFELQKIGGSDIIYLSPKDVRKR